jgi:hypothetical protein
MNMRKTWICIIILGILPLILVILSFFYQLELVKFFNSLGWGKIAGFVSGPWWTNSIPVLILAWGVGVAIWQISQARRSINAQTALEVFRELRNPETIEKLRLIYELTQENLQNIPIEKSKEIDHVIDKYSALEVWVANGIIDKEIAVEAGPPALRCWYRLHNYITSVRNRRGYYGDNFEAYVRVVLDHFRKNKMHVRFWREGHQDEEIDLVIELDKEDLRPRSLKEIKRDRKKQKA